MAIYDDFTLDELKGFRKALMKSIATGATSVSYESYSINYRNANEMRAAARMIDDEIASREGATPRPRLYRADSRKGFD